ncbi:MAG: carboxypeptidase-like regulatory domain-containing protein [Candidatus Eremiobacterota bacterium]
MCIAWSRFWFVFLLLLGCSGQAPLAPAQVAAQQDSPQPLALLFVQSAETGTFSDSRLVLNGRNSVLFFSDRPGRIFGNLAQDRFVADYASFFADDPPNAVLEFDRGEDRAAVVLTLLEQAADSTGVAYRVSPIQNASTDYGHSTTEFSSVPPLLTRPTLFIDDATVSAGGLTGTVFDTQQMPLAGATVSVSSSAGVRTVATDGRGEFRFPVLPPGTYGVKVEITGFKPIERRVVVELGRVASVEIVVGVGDLQEP